jgi:hypothetical protein
MRAVVDAIDDLLNKPKIRKQIRELANAVGSTYPIVAVNGCEFPHYCGKSGFHCTPAGTVVRFPSAYRKAGGKAMYVTSTRRIEVGRDWLLDNIVPAVYFKSSIGACCEKVCS